MHSSKLGQIARVRDIDTDQAQAGAVDLNLSLFKIELPTVQPLQVVKRRGVAGLPGRANAQAQELVRNVLDVQVIHFQFVLHVQKILVGRS
jgi:hypothetical protein